MRHKLDFYETPPPLTLALLDYKPDLVCAAERGRVYECAAGELAIAEFLPGCLTNDINPERPTDLHLDATLPESWEGIEPLDWVVSNVPWSLAHLIIPLAYDWARVGVAFLLRLSYDEPVPTRPDRPGRGEWLIAHEENFAGKIVFNPRPSFKRNGKTDSVTAAWFLWMKQPQWLGVRHVMGWR